MSTTLCEFHGMRSSHDMTVTRFSIGVDKAPEMLVQFTIGNQFCTLKRQDVKILITELVDVI